MKRKGFSFIETIISIFLIAVLSIYMLPALKNSVKAINISTSKTSEIFELQKAIELSKSYEMGTYQFEYVNTIYVSIREFSSNLKIIHASSSHYELEVVVLK